MMEEARARIWVSRASDDNSGSKRSNFQCEALPGTEGTSRAIERTFLRQPIGANAARLSTNRLTRPQDDAWACWERATSIKKAAPTAEQPFLDALYSTAKGNAFSSYVPLPFLAIPCLVLSSIASRTPTTIPFYFNVGSFTSFGSYKMYVWSLKLPLKAFRFFRIDKNICRICDVYFPRKFFVYITDALDYMNYSLTRMIRQ